MILKSARVEPGVRRRLSRASNQKAWQFRQMSIVTGRPPAVHGICGNYFLDPDTGKEVMMNDPKFLRVETLFPAFQRAGCRIAVVTGSRADRRPGDKRARRRDHGVRGAVESPGAYGA